MTWGQESERTYRVIKAVTTPLYRGLTRVRVVGKDNVPAQGGVIVAANHISFFDSVALLQSIPRRAFFIGKAEYMNSWTTRRLFPAMGLIPIEREQARKAMAALEVAADVLRRGDALGIYPEGTRSRDGLLHKGHTGVAQLAMMSGAPIVPVGLVGTDHIQPIGARVPRPFRQAVVRFGTPLDPTAYGGSAASSPAAADRRPDGGDPPPQRSGRSDDFSDATPPLVRGGNESVYQVHAVGGVGAVVGPGGPLRRRRRVQRVRRRPGGHRAPPRLPRDARRRRPLRHRGRGVREVPTRQSPDAGQEAAVHDEQRSTYHVIELIGSSSDSWELAAQNAVREAAKVYEDLRVAEVVEMDVLIENGVIIAYRTKLRLSYKGTAADVLAAVARPSASLSAAVEA